MIKHVKLFEGSRSEIPMLDHSIYRRLTKTFTFKIVYSVKRKLVNLNK